MNTEVFHRRSILYIAFISLFALSLSGCGIFHPDDYRADGPSLTASSNPQEVQAEDFGHSWNLTVDHGTISCELDGDNNAALRFTAPDGTVYAINFVDKNTDLPSIEKIADGSVGPLRTFAFTVCDV